METPIERDKARVIHIADTKKEFVTDSDGFVYWWPTGTSGGHMDARHLRWLADELDKRNQPWRDHVNAMFT